MQKVEFEIIGQFVQYEQTVFEGKQYNKIVVKYTTIKGDRMIGFSVDAECLCPELKMGSKVTMGCYLTSYQNKPSIKVSTIV